MKDNCQQTNTRISVSVTPERYKWLRESAENSGQSISQYCNHLMDIGFNNWDEINVESEETEAIKRCNSHALHHPKRSEVEALAEKYSTLKSYNDIQKFQCMLLYKLSKLCKQILDKLTCHDASNKSFLDDINREAIYVSHVLYHLTKRNK